MIGLLRSFGYAFQGVAACLLGERNFRIHTLAGAMAIAMGAYYRLSGTQWAVLLLAIALVLCCEAVNTAVEAAVDLVSPGEHPHCQTGQRLCRWGGAAGGGGFRWGGVLPFRGPGVFIRLFLFVGGFPCKSSGKRPFVVPLPPLCVLPALVGEEEVGPRKGKDVPCFPSCLPRREASLRFGFLHYDQLRPKAGPLHAEKGG